MGKSNITCSTSKEKAGEITCNINTGLPKIQLTYKECFKSAPVWNIGRHERRVTIYKDKDKKKYLKTKSHPRFYKSVKYWTDENIRLWKNNDKENARTIESWTESDFKTNLPKKLKPKDALESGSYSELDRIICSNAKERTFIKINVRTQAERDRAHDENNENPCAYRKKRWVYVGLPIRRGHRRSCVNAPKKDGRCTCYYNLEYCEYKSILPSLTRSYEKISQRRGIQYGIRGSATITYKDMPKFECEFITMRYKEHRDGRIAGYWPYVRPHVKGASKGIFINKTSTIARHTEKYLVPFVFNGLIELKKQGSLKKEDSWYNGIVLGKRNNRITTTPNIMIHPSHLPVRLDGCIALGYKKDSTDFGFVSLEKSRQTFKDLNARILVEQKKKLNATIDRIQFFVEIKDKRPCTNNNKKPSLRLEREIKGPSEVEVGKEYTFTATRFPSQNKILPLMHWLVREVRTHLILLDNKIGDTLTITIPKKWSKLSSAANGKVEIKAYFPHEQCGYPCRKMAGITVKVK